PADALCPAGPASFVAEAQRFRQAGAAPVAAGERTLPPAVQRNIFASHAISADRVAQLLALAAIIANIALWGFVFAIYPNLNDQIQIEFPPIGDVTTLEPRSEI